MPCNLLHASQHASTIAELVANGYTLVADTLARLGVRFMFGVVGIPVTELASAAQVLLRPLAKPCRVLQSRFVTIPTSMDRYADITLVLSNLMPLQRGSRYWHECPTLDIAFSTQR